ncbi:MAG: LytTR family DNA-binding domain-containing protein [Bacteroidota bacterium]
MNPIRTLLIDDEESALITLTGMIGKFCPQIQIVAKAKSIEEGLSAIRQHQPQLVFLDIEMPPGGKAFDLLRALPDRQFGIIFSTAYPQYALQAINDAQPWGYIIKPYRVSDLVLAVHTAQAKIQERNLPTNQSPLDLPDEKGIIIPDRRKGNVVILLKDIIYCKADHRTTDIHYLKKEALARVTSSQSLKSMEEQLPNHIFCRTHHSYLVNMKHIIRYQRTGRNGVIYLPHKQTADISVLKMDTFEQRFRNLLNG